MFIMVLQCYFGITMHLQVSQQEISGRAAGFHCVIYNPQSNDTQCDTLLKNIENVLCVH